MTIGRTPNGIITLTPDVGKGITNGIAVTADIVFLGKYAEPSDWWDCDLPQPEDDREATEDDFIESLSTLGVKF